MLVHQRERVDGLGELRDGVPHVGGGDRWQVFGGYTVVLLG